jgi:hypothetical protein
MTRGRQVFAGALLLLSFVALSAWYFMPIYPDEIAFRLQLGRYIQDRGVVYGLYPLCASNIKETPLIFVIPAWILSWFDLSLSPAEIRVFPFVIVLAAVFLAVWHSIRGVNPKAALVATTAFIGVAGSGLAVARYEYIQVLNILCCLGVFHFLALPFLRTCLRYGLFVLLLISSLLSMYAHVQGLLFIPLTLYLAYHLLRPGLGKPTAASFVVILLILMAQATIRFHHTTCAGYPEIEAFWAQMTFSMSESVNWTGWLSAKFDKYSLSFLYKENYAVNYLPGIDFREGWKQNMLAVINQSIHTILLVNLLLVVAFTIAILISAVKQYLPQRACVAPTRPDHSQAIALVLIVLPVIFLFIYDFAQNFYRSFFLNLVIAIVLSLLLARARLARVRPLANLYFYLCGAAVVASWLINVWWFTSRLHAGYEGPSISHSRDWNSIRRDVNALAKDCGMDLSKGRIVLDDMTYDSLKSYPRLYAATYMGLSAGIIKTNMGVVIEKVHPNYVIARCDTMRRTSIEIQKSRNQLCCANFLRPNQ